MFEGSTFMLVAIFALAAMIVNGIGILFVYKNKEAALNAKEYFMCFAAGTLISSSLTVAFPHALEKNSGAGLAALAGFTFMFFCNKIVKHKTKDKKLAFGITALVGIGIHSFIDGIIYSVTFSASTYIGLLAGAGLVAHEFAEGVITFAALVSASLSSKKSMFYAFLCAGLTTPVGAFLVYPVVNLFSSSMLGAALGWVSGVLIYLSAAHLLPAVKDGERGHSYLSFVFGLALSLLIAYSQK